MAVEAQENGQWTAGVAVAVLQAGDVELAGKTKCAGELALVHLKPLTKLSYLLGVHAWILTRG